jgi:hypothetical protein
MRLGVTAAGTVLSSFLTARATIQNPTARWVFQYFVGIHLLCIPGEWPLVLNLTDTHECLLQLLGQPYKAFYS